MSDSTAGSIFDKIIFEAKRRQLISKGWKQSKENYNGAPLWISSDGAVFTEERAFRLLERDQGGSDGDV